MLKRTILIKIAAYRDPELTKTIKSALETAFHPERISFAIVNQVGEETAGQLNDFQNDPRFTIREFQWQQSQGLGWARNLCDRLWAGEHYSFQIDSHMRFVNGWDYKIIENFESWNNPNIVLSTYPSIYTFENGHEKYEKTLPHRVAINNISPEGIPVLAGLPQPAAGMWNLFVAGGYQFAIGNVCQKVPNHRFVWYGDETAHSIRLFTHGYKVHVPEDIIAYHLYERHKWMRVFYWHEDMRTTSVLQKRWHRFLNANMYVMNKLLDITNREEIGSKASKEDFQQQLKLLSDYKLFLD